MNRLAVLAALAAASLTQAVPTLAADGVEVPIEKAAANVAVEGHPLTSVVVTQCNLVVAVYMTMPDGRLLRFDKSANVGIDELLKMAYTATRSERVEVSCNDTGLVGYEKHESPL
jgi:ribosomal protein L14